MAKMYYEKDCDPDILKGKKIAVIGYGSQGHAHALNLQDSGVRRHRRPVRRLQVRAEGARTAGLHVMVTADAVAAADIDHDPRQRRKAGRAVQEGYRAQPQGRARRLAFAHGFNIHFGQIVPPEDVSSS